MRTGKLIVADSDNIIPGWNLADETLWDFGDHAEHMPVSRSLPGGYGSIQFDPENNPPNEIIRVAKSIRFSMEPEEDYFVGYGIWGSSQKGGPTYKTKAKIVFYDRDGDEIDEISFGYETSDAGGLNKIDGAIVTPTGTQTADFRLYVWGGITERLLEMGTPIARKKQIGALLIKPNSITGAELIQTQEIISSTAQMGALTVGTANILHNAVANPATAVRGNRQNALK